MIVAKKKIAIADDDPGVQDIFKIIFEKAGYEILNCGSGKDMLQSKELPALYILDKQLSGINGLDICVYLKGNHTTMNIPVIMISATPGLGLLARQAGANDFLEKPFRKKELLDMVAKYISCEIEQLSTKSL